MAKFGSCGWIIITDGEKTNDIFYNNKNRIDYYTKYVLCYY